MHELLQTHLPTVYRFARQQLGDAHAAEDVAQEAMLRAWRNRRKLRDPQAGKVWLLRITANLCRDYGRRQARERGYTEFRREQPAPDPEPASVPQLVQGREAAQRVLAEMRRLPDRPREVLYLFAVEGLTHEQIGRVLGIAPQTSRVTLSRARKLLRENLADLIAPTADERQLKKDG